MLVYRRSGQAPWPNPPSPWAHGTAGPPPKYRLQSAARQGEPTLHAAARIMLHRRLLSSMSSRTCPMSRIYKFQQLLDQLVGSSLVVDTMAANKCRRWSHKCSKTCGCVCVCVCVCVCAKGIGKWLEQGLRLYIILTSSFTLGLYISLVIPLCGVCNSTLARERFPRILPSVVISISFPYIQACGG